MTVVFYLSAAVAVISTALMITRENAIHALLYMVLSLFSVAVIFFVLGAPFAAALEVIIYAGAIMVLFVFVIMMLAPGAHRTEESLGRPGLSAFVVPGVIALVLVGEITWVVFSGSLGPASGASVAPDQVGAALFGRYLSAVEMASLLLLAGLVGAYHLARRDPAREDEGGERS